MDLAANFIRALHMLGMCVAAGALFCSLALLPAAAPAGARQDMARLCRLGLALALLGALLLIVAQAAIVVAGRGEILPALRPLLLQTGFGHAILARIGLLAVILLLLVWPSPRPSRGREAVAAIALFLAFLPQMRLGHAAGSDEAVLPLALLLHVVPAAVWIGTLVALLRLLSVAPQAGVGAARRFAPYGVLIVACIVAGGAGAAWRLTGSYAGLLGTDYGLIILAKSALIAVMLVLALANRRLAGHAASAPRLRWSIFIEALMGLAAIALAARLATIPPAIHLDPVWPFSVRPMRGLLDDTFFRDAVLRRAPYLALAVALLCLIPFIRKGRWIALAAAAAALLAMPNFPLRPFLEPAVPTSFASSATGLTAASAMAGAQTYAQTCARCHGPDARGRGPDASGDPRWPPNLTAPYFSSRNDGELFWSISAGMRLPDGRSSMPAFAEELDARRIWELVDYLRLSTGENAVRTASPRGAIAPFRMPRIALRCEDGHRVIGGERAAPLMIVLAREGGEAVLPDGSVIDLSGKTGTQAPACRGGDEAALAVLDRLRGTAGDAWLLVDGQGWARNFWARRPLLEEISSALSAAREPIVGPGGHH